MTTGICDFAIWRPGPKWKAGYTVFGRTSEKHGVVDHSSEGNLAATLGVLDSWRTASWQFTNDDSGLYQHYPISDVCWHAGFEANKKYVGVESTGRKGERLTDRQYDQLLGLHFWLREQGVLTVCELRADLWEHGWLWPTDCPSGRIPWDRLIADLKEEPMVDWPKEKLRLIDDPQNENRAFWEWVDRFPETQAEKDGLEEQIVRTGSSSEQDGYTLYYAARQQMEKRQIGWRSPPR